MKPVSREAIRRALSVDHAQEWRRHTAGMQRPTLRRSDDHLFPKIS